MAKKPTFTVDTHLFRELGTLLVGRASTALIELIKNAYDADAEEVYVYGSTVNDRENGYIRVRDDGVGMTFAEFEQGFLRIASRSKDTQERRSRLHKRKYTGAKGIGRLAAHKLAEELVITSVAKDAEGQRQRVDARIDWRAIEKKTTLDELGEDEVSVKSSVVAGKGNTGTEITLKRLRQKWTPTELARFLAEVQGFEPPELFQLPLASGKYRLLDEDLLFTSLRVRDSKNEDRFHVFLEGDFTSGDHYWSMLTEAVEWVIEVDASSKDKPVRYGIAPTRNLKKDFPLAEPRIYEGTHPNPEDGPFFQARILVRKAGWTNAEKAKRWAKLSSGIRVFMEGFRVLPYGEYRDDWLSINEEYTNRERTLQLGRGLLSTEEQQWENEHEDIGLSRLAGEMYFGAVFLTEKGAPSLQMLVNREGFVPDPSFETLVNLLRTAIHLFVRVRAAVRAPVNEKRKQRKKASTSPKESPTPVSEEPSSGTTPGELVKDVVSNATGLAREAKALVSAGKAADAQEKVLEAIAAIREIEETWQMAMDEYALLRVLATVGTQMAAFVHEIRSMLGMAQSVEGTLTRLIDSRTLDKSTRQSLAKLQSSMGDLRRTLERQAAYLVDIIVPDARRRRSRQGLAERFDASVRLVQTSAEKRSITIENKIPTGLKSPPMFPAELVSVFSNLLSNAVKFAKSGGRVRATGATREDDTVHLVIENTGVAVDVKNSERWFRPFESTTVNVDAVLGQGMGLGLTITRNLLEQYGAEIRFIKPSSGFATALEIVFPM